MDIKLDPRYWECCCETNFVHSKFGELDMCERCGALEEDSPDARSDEFDEVHCLTCDAVYPEIHGSRVKACPECGNTDAKQTVYLENTHEA